MPIHEGHILARIEHVLARIEGDDSDLRLTLPRVFGIASATIDASARAPSGGDISKSRTGPELPDHGSRRVRSFLDNDQVADIAAGALSAQEATFGAIESANAGYVAIFTMAAYYPMYKRLHALDGRHQ